MAETIGPYVHEPIAASASGNTTILAAVTGKKLRVFSLYFITADAVTVRFESDTDGSALSGEMSFPANGGIVLPHNPAGWFETVSGELLSLELSAAVAIAGGIVYAEVTVT